MKNGWIVRRRYSDFVWLRALLSSKFTGLFLPALPPKGGDVMKSSSTDLSKDSFVVCRQQHLRYFLDGVGRIPVLRSDPSLQAFLSIQDLKEFAAAKESTASIEAENDLNEGIQGWRAAVTGFKPPMTWDRGVADYTRQLDAMDGNLKVQQRNLGLHLDALNAAALSVGRLLESFQTSAELEVSFGDSTKMEFKNKDSTRATAVSAAVVKAFEMEHKVAVTAPLNVELIVSTGMKYQALQVAAFREHLKQAAELTKLETAETKTLNVYLDAERNGKPVKKAGSFMSSKKKDPQEIIQEQKDILEKRSQVKNMFVSALEFSEIDRFNVERTRFASEVRRRR